MNDLVRGRIDKFSLDALMKLAAQAGLSVHVKVVRLLEPIPTRYLRGRCLCTTRHVAAGGREVPQSYCVRLLLAGGDHSRKKRWLAQRPRRCAGAITVQAMLTVPTQSRPSFGAQRES